MLTQFALVGLKLLEMNLLEWKPNPSNPNDDGSHETTILEAIYSKHYFMGLLGLLTMDKNSIFGSSLEYMVFTFVYLIHSFLLASDHVLSEYNKKVRL